MTDIQTLVNPPSARGIYAENESIYNLKEQVEEEKLFKINKSIKVLLNELENRNKTTAEQKDEDKAQ